ncbi:hypothetical protein EV421DRAFT_1745055 [Armillaria borealis]|uniref:Uncharacterized protein n=1 Tax=Armillaria borealis TaxID=47425 RepID=A0AA39MDH5_9AGAR|nr:hypothetical protein EV421DRAFT_1745055 [Armillaria borealis]
MYQWVNTPPSTPTLNSAEPSHMLEWEDECPLKEDQSTAENENSEVWIRALWTASTAFVVSYSWIFLPTTARSDAKPMCSERAVGPMEPSSSSFAYGSQILPISATIEGTAEGRGKSRSATFQRPDERIEFEDWNEYLPSSYMCLTHSTVHNEDLRRRLPKV